MSGIYERLPILAANARNFVSQVDAPTLHDRLNKMATACDEAYGEISLLRAQLAAADRLVEERKFWRPCRGVPDTWCDYLASCGTVCAKCGRIHNGFCGPIDAAIDAQIEKGKA